MEIEEYVLDEVLPFYEDVFGKDALKVFDYFRKILKSSDIGVESFGTKEQIIIVKNEEVDVSKIRFRLFRAIDHRIYRVQCKYHPAPEREVYIEVDVISKTENYTLLHTFVSGYPENVIDFLASMISLKVLVSKVIHSTRRFSDHDDYDRWW